MSACKQYEFEYEIGKSPVEWMRSFCNALTLFALTVYSGLCHIIVNQEPKMQLLFTLAGERMLFLKGVWCGPGPKGEPENAALSLFSQHC